MFTDGILKFRLFRHEIRNGVIIMYVYDFKNDLLNISRMLS